MIQLPEMTSSFVARVACANREIDAINRRYHRIVLTLAERSGGPYNFERRLKCISRRWAREQDRAWLRYEL